MCSTCAEMSYSPVTSTPLWISSFRHFRLFGSKWNMRLEQGTEKSNKRDRKDRGDILDRERGEMVQEQVRDGGTTPRTSLVSVSGVNSPLASRSRLRRHSHYTARAQLPTMSIDGYRAARSTKLYTCLLPFLLSPLLPISPFSQIPFPLILFPSSLPFSSISFFSLLPPFYVSLSLILQ